MSHFVTSESEGQTIYICQNVLVSKHPQQGKKNFQLSREDWKMMINFEPQVLNLQFQTLNFLRPFS